ncbi:unnamed protein product [Tenebrio molitor]|nr:unnamed protein product [Tenebrio molitor]
MRHCMGEIFSDIYFKTVRPFIGFFVLDKPCLLLRNPQIIKRILINDFQYFYDRNILNNKRDDPIATHVLFILKNPEWKEVRSKITPIFTSSKIKVMSKLMENVAEEMVHYLNKKIQHNAIIEIKDICLKFIVDVISTTAFGVNAYSFKNENSEFNTIAKTLLDWDNILNSFRIRCYILTPKIAKLFKMCFLNPYCTRVLKKRFLEIMDSRTISKINRNDLIDILLRMKENKQFTDEDVVVAQAVTFFVAGSETTSSTMGFALYEIAHHPDIQRRLRTEIGNAAQQHEGINFDSVREMPYLDMCVKEVLRKYPVVPFLERKCNNNYKIPETDVVIERGTPVFISVLGLHYDPQYFPNPEVFDPERFSKNNEDQIEKFVYLPFGDGPRNCIGARFGIVSAKLGLAYIISNFIVDICEDTQDKIKFNPNGLVLSSIKGISLKLRKI